MSRKQMGFIPIFRPEMGYTDYVEKRQLFLRSYHFSRKQSISERIKKSFFRVKKVIRVRLRSVKRLRKIVWFRLKHGFFFYSAKKRKFLRLHNYHSCYKSNGLHCPSSCLW